MPASLSTLHVADTGAARILTFDRPARLNAIDITLAGALRDSLAAALADPSVRVLVLAGSGGNFCTGADLSNAGTDSVLPLLHECFLLIHCGPKPCIAAVEGYAYGGGLSLALACDFIVAGAGASFCAPFTGIGLIPDVGMSWTLPQRVGPARARTWMFEGTAIDAEEALASGLVDTMVDAGAALDAALERAARLATRAPMAIAALRTLLNPAAPAAAALAEEMAIQATLRGSDHFAEALRAFKRRGTPGAGRG
jgi:2-(1,2-epoxy-1,2-dihydrophenyl)acetyl-CoA isomerase